MPAPRPERTKHMRVIGATSKPVATRISSAEAGAYQWESTEKRPLIKRQRARCRRGSARLLGCRSTATAEGGVRVGHHGRESIGGQFETQHKFYNSYHFYVI